MPAPSHEPPRSEPASAVPPRTDRAGAAWTLERRRGSAQALHDAALRDGGGLLVVNEVDRPALVLGSTQLAADVDLAALERRGVELARRRSGGGAVLLEPGRHLWVDVVLPATDRRWVDDVARSSSWLGRVWVEVLRSCAGAGLAGRTVEVARRVDRRAAGRLACFAGTGPGEVVVDGAKLVGLSQRRTRRSARFQCLVHRRWDPEPTLSLLAADRAEVARPWLSSAVTGLDELGVEQGWDLVGELLARLG